MSQLLTSYYYNGLLDLRTIVMDFKVDAMDFYGHNKNICKIKD